MKKRQFANIEASIRQRLLNLSREHGEDYNFVLTRYANERFLYRLSQSAHVGKFILKGGMLFLTWTKQLYRPTQDIDLLGFGDSSDEAIIQMVEDICNTEVEPDGLIFDTDAIHVEEIREDQEYQGKRIKLSAGLGNAHIYLQVDIGFGDAVTPEALIIEFPTMLESPKPKLRSYPKETMVAEKLETMVRLGMINSRMKDFYDTWMVSKVFAFDGYLLHKAVKATFNRRKTAIPRLTPIALTHEFAEDKDRIKQWNAFLKRNGLDIGGVELKQVIDDINSFLNPIISAISSDQAFRKTWSAGGCWAEIQ